jgi:hypothetical protein
MKSNQFNSGYGSGNADSFNPDNGIPVWNEINDPNIAFLQANFLDYNGDFSYENFEQITGMTYYKYLRSQDDMI